MMNNHNFNFDGGEVLARIGATFFVAYLFYLYVDPTYLLWRNILTSNIRIRRINLSRNYHIYWLHRVLEMNDLLLERNHLGLMGPDIKEKAQQILHILETRNI